MEVLGFIETPLAVPTWSTPPPSPVQLPSPPPQSPSSSGELFLAGWEPTEPRSLAKRVRWGLVLGLTVLVAAGSALAVWLYRQPAVDAARALTAVQEAAGLLDDELAALEALNASLLGPDQDLTQATAVLLKVDDRARALFESSAELSTADAELRVRAADAAGQALDAAQQLDDIIAYRAAVLPLLVPPSLETDPELITLEEAARLFGEWRAGFDRVRAAISDGVLPEVTAELDLISAELETIQREYLDALRSGIVADAPFRTLSLRLAAANRTLEEALEASQATVADRISNARALLAELVG